MTRKRARAAAGPFDMYAYWLMPHGLRGLMTTIFWPAARGTRSRATRRARPGVNRRRAGRHSPVPGPPRPFAILAPGKMEREIGQHTFWRGSLWGRTVALQGDSSFTKYDLFEITRDGAALLGYLPRQRLLRQRGKPQLLVALRLDGPAHERGRLQAAARHRLAPRSPAAADHELRRADASRRGRGALRQLARPRQPDRLRGRPRGALLGPLSGTDLAGGLSPRQGPRDDTLRVEEPRRSRAACTTSTRSPSSTTRRQMRRRCRGSIRSTTGPTSGTGSARTS